MSVLSHLALQFSSQPENLATEALAYILDRSQPARRGLQQLTANLSGRVLDIQRLETQAINPDLSRPDLCGFDQAGARTLLVEAKFWAGLTDAQPNGYLAAMDCPGVLLFVAPEARLEILWDELMRRIDERHGAAPAPPAASPARGMARQVGEHIVALTSWRRLLKTVELEAVTADETRTIADISQLQALCERMDTDAFLPLTSEELTSSLGRRVLQYERLVGDIAAQLVIDGFANTDGLRPAAGLGYSGRYIRMRGGIIAFLGFSANSWSAFGQSPMWLEIASGSGQIADISLALRNALAVAGLRYWERDRIVCLPIVPPVGVERDGVMAACVQQLIAITAALPEINALAP